MAVETATGVAMYRIESNIDTQSQEYKDNFEHMTKAVAQYKERLTRVQEGGPKKYRDLQKSRGKLLPRERLDKLFDRNTPFVELSPLAAWERPQIWEYIQKNDVPYNELHERGYPTVGCAHCTKAVPGSTPADYSRAGRWAGSEKTECGLHHGAGI